MNDTPNPTTPPDHLAIDPASPHFDRSALERGVGIRFKGVERTDVEEYSVSQGWIKVALGKKVNRHGRPLTIKLTGPVEAFFHDRAGEPAETSDGESHEG